MPRGRSITETVQFVLSVKNGQVAAREFERVGKAAEDGLGKVENNFEKTGRLATAAGTKLVAFGTIALAGLGKAARATQDLRLSQLTTNKVFGDAVGAIDKFAETSVEKFGLSERAYRQAAANLGAFLTNLGFDLPEAAEQSNNLLEIATDIAAAYGRTTGEAINAITAALRGERDTIEQFGIALKQVDVNARVAALGLDVSTAEAKKNAEAVATVSLITEQAAKFQGIYASEANKANRAQQELSAEFENAAAAIGEATLPVLADLLGTLGGLVGGFNDLDPVVKGAISQAALWTAGLALVAGALLIVDGAVLRLIGKLKGDAGLVGLLKSLGPKAGIAAVGVGLVAAALFKASKSSEEARIRAEAYTEALRNELDPVTLLTDRIAGLASQLRDYSAAASDAESDTEGVGGRVELLRDELQKFDDLEGANRILAELGLTLGDLVGELENGTNAFDVLNDEVFVSDKTIQEAAKTVGGFAEEVVNAGLAAGLTDKQILEIARNFDRFADAADKSREKLEDTNRDSALLAVSMGSLSQEFLDAAVAAAEAEGSTAPYTDAMRNLEGTLATAVSEQAEFNRLAEESADRYDDAASKGGLLSDAVREMGTSANSTRGYFDALASNLQSFLNVELEKFEGLLGNINDEIDKFIGAGDAERDFEAALDRLAEGIKESAEKLGDDLFNIDEDLGRINDANFDDVLRSLGELTTGLTEAETPIDDIATALTDWTARAKEELSEQGALTDDLAAKLDALPFQLTFILETQGYSAALDDVNFLRDAIEGTPNNLDIDINIADYGGPVRIPVELDITNAATLFSELGLSPSQVRTPTVSPFPDGVTLPISNTATRSAPAGIRASGGTVGAGGAYLVGERGPEILQMGRSGGTIIPNNAISSGGGGVTHVHVMLDGREIGLAVVDESQRSGGLPIKLAAS